MSAMRRFHCNKKIKNKNKIWKNENSIKKTTVDQNFHLKNIKTKTKTKILKKMKADQTCLGDHIYDLLKAKSL